jgi:PAS domain S-box-containing protein
VDRQAEAAARQLNERLEQRVVARTRQLEAANEALREEIAERQRVEDDLRWSEDYLRLVIDTIPQQIWSGPPDGSLDFCNAQWRSYMGLTQEELQGEGWQSMLHPDDRERVLKAWRESVVNGMPYENEERHRGANGQYRWFLARGVPLRDAVGHIDRWYGTNTDIEDRKRAEWALHEVQAELSHVTRVTTMGELVAAIAHELNQPLAAIVTNANFCSRQFAGATPDSDKLREAISEIANDATRASAVISRIRALLQKGTPERLAVDINRIIQEVTTLLRGQLIRNHVSLRADLAPDLQGVSGDRVQLQQVMINLIMNSIEAMRSIVDRPRELVIKSARSHDEVLIQVKDSGEGLDQQQQEHIFEPFFTTKPEGIGMGLSISRSIVESHGGRLWAESGPTGALFQFTLPIDRNDAA